MKILDGQIKICCSMNSMRRPFTICKKCFFEMNNNKKKNLKYFDIKLKFDSKKRYVLVYFYSEKKNKLK